MVTAILAPSDDVIVNNYHRPHASSSKNRRVTSSSSKIKGSQSSNDRRRSSINKHPVDRRRRNLSEGSMSSLGMHDFTFSMRTDDAVLPSNNNTTKPGQAPPRVVISKNSTDIPDDDDDVGGQDVDEKARSKQQQQQQQHSESRITKACEKVKKEEKEKQKGHRRRRDFRRAPHLQATLDRIRARQGRGVVDDIDPSSPKLQSAMDRMLRTDTARSIHHRQHCRSESPQNRRNPSRVRSSNNDVSPRRRNIQFQHVVETDENNNRQNNNSLDRFRRRQVQRPAQTSYNLGDAPFTAKLFEGTKIESIDSVDDWGLPRNSSPSRSRRNNVISSTMGRLSPNRLLNVSADRRVNLRIASIARDVRQRQRLRLQQQGSYESQYRHHHRKNHPRQEQSFLEIIDTENLDDDLIPANWRKKEQHPNPDITKEPKVKHDESRIDGGRSRRINLLRKQLERIRSQSHERRRTQTPTRRREEPNTHSLDIDNRIQSNTTTQPNRIDPPPSTPVNRNYDEYSAYSGHYGESSVASPQPALSPRSNNENDESIVWEKSTNKRKKKEGGMQRHQSERQNERQDINNLKRHQNMSRQMPSLLTMNNSHSTNGYEQAQRQEKHEETGNTVNDDDTLDSDGSDSDDDDDSDSDMSEDDYNGDMMYTLPSLSDAFISLLPKSHISQQGMSPNQSSLLQESQKPSRLHGPVPQLDDRYVRHQIIDYDEIDHSSSHEEMARHHFLPISSANKANAPMPIFEELDDDQFSNSTNRSGFGSWTGRKSGRNSPTPSEKARMLLRDVEQVQSISKRMQYRQRKMQEEMMGVKERFHGSFDAMEKRVKMNRIAVKDNILKITEGRQFRTNRSLTNTFEGGDPYLGSQEAAPNKGVANVVEKFLQPGVDESTLHRHGQGNTLWSHVGESDHESHSNGSVIQETTESAKARLHEHQALHFLPLSPSYKSQNSSSMDTGTSTNTNEDEDSTDREDEVMQRFSISWDDKKQVIGTAPQGKVLIMQELGDDDDEDIENDESDYSDSSTDVSAVPRRNTLRRVPRSLLSTASSSIGTLNSKNTLDAAIESVIALSLLNEPGSISTHTYKPPSMVRLRDYDTPQQDYEPPLLPNLEPSSGKDPGLSNPTFTDGESATATLASPRGTAITVSLPGNKDEKRRQKRR